MLASSLDVPLQEQKPLVTIRQQGCDQSSNDDLMLVYLRLAGCLRAAGGRAAGRRQRVPLSRPTR